MFGKTTGFFTNSWRIEIALESYFEEYAQEVWERNWMNPEMQTTLLNAHPPKLIATILKARREQLKKNDQLNAVEEIAGPVPEIPLEYDQILKGGRFAPSLGAERSYRRTQVKDWNRGKEDENQVVAWKTSDPNYTRLTQSTRLVTFSLWSSRMNTMILHEVPRVQNHEVIAI